jgi:hypothetical protein
VEGSWFGLVPSLALEPVSGDENRMQLEYLCAVLCCDGDDGVDVVAGNDVDDDDDSGGDDGDDSGDDNDDDDSADVYNED